MERRLLSETIGHATQNDKLTNPWSRDSCVRLRSQKAQKSLLNNYTSGIT